MSTRTLTPLMAVALEVLPVPLPLTVVDVNRPVTSDVSTKRLVVAEAVRVAVMTSCHTPVGVLDDDWQGALELLAQTVTVWMAAVALLLAVAVAVAVTSPPSPTWPAQPAPSATTHRQLRM